MDRYNKQITIVSETFPRHQIREILKTPGTYVSETHVLYPADSEGAHLLSFFSIEEIAKNPQYVDWIIKDMARWIERERIEFDVIFVPNEPSVAEIAEELAWELAPCDLVLWEYQDTGRFGDKLVFGKIRPGERVLVMNGVTQQGRCVGQRLPGFVESLGGRVVGAAVFAKGTTGLVKACELKYESKFYSAVQADIPVFSENECPVCLAGGRASLRPWTTLLTRET